jgi:tetratricopeptide (TPR) repeat protein
MDAAAALQQKDSAKALSFADRAVALAPNDSEAHLVRCRALAGLRRYEDAVAACSDSLRLKPDNIDALRDRGHFALNLGRIEPALSDLRRAESMTKSDRGVYYHLGMAYYLRHDFPSAAKAYEGCVRNSPDDSLRVECEAWLYPSLRRAGRDADARALLNAIAIVGRRRGSGVRPQSARCR